MFDMSKEYVLIFFVVMNICDMHDKGNRVVRWGSDAAHLVLRLPFSIGVVTTLLLFRGWLRTERGTVILAGNFPYKDI